MKRLAAVSCLVLCLMPTGSARTEGLIYELPEDGTWAQFDLVETNSRAGVDDAAVTGTLKLSSVGKATRLGEPCRWIEFLTIGKRNGRQFTDVDKLLLWEKDLAKTGAPIKRIANAFYKSSAIENGKLLQSFDLDAESSAYFLGKEQLYLHGPFEDAKKLEAIPIDGKLGKLGCEGISAHERFTDKRQAVVFDSTYTIRFHKNAPFGVVEWECETKTAPDEKRSAARNIKLKLSDFGKGAKSSIPEAE